MVTIFAPKKGGGVVAVNDYLDFVEATGYGTGEGLCGWNCRQRHIFFPFVDGISERTYTDEQLENIDPPPFEYQGKTYTAYEATQKQRQIETAMRKCKREIIGFKAAGLEEDYQDSSIRLRRLTTEYKAFSKAAGLKEQTERSSIEGFGVKEAKVSMSAAKPVIDVGETKPRLASIYVDEQEVGGDGSKRVQCH